MGRIGPKLCSMSLKDPWSCVVEGVVEGKKGEGEGEGEGKREGCLLFDSEGLDLTAKGGRKPTRGAPPAPHRGSGRDNAGVRRAREGERERERERRRDSITIMIMMMSG